MRKLVLMVLCIVFVFCGCTTKRMDNAGGSGNDNDNVQAEEQPTTEGSTNYHPEFDTWIKGYYLESKNGEAMIIHENSPIVMSQASDLLTIVSIFENLNNGDLIEVRCNYIRESYPGQTDVLSVKLLEKGSMDNINSDVLKSLEELGWLENETTVATPDIVVTEKQELTGYYLKENDLEYIVVDEEKIYIRPHSDLISDVEVIYGYENGDLITIWCELEERDGMKTAGVLKSEPAEE